MFLFISARYVALDAGRLNQDAGPSQEVSVGLAAANIFAGLESTNTERNASDKRTQEVSVIISILFQKYSLAGRYFFIFVYRNHKKGRR